LFTASQRERNVLREPEPWLCDKAKAGTDMCVFVKVYGWMCAVRV